MVWGIGPVVDIGFKYPECFTEAEVVEIISKMKQPVTDMAERVARRMAQADRPDYPDNEQFWEGYLPQARMWLAAYDAQATARLEGGDVD
jgi:hypothetical protein